jgi:hypothetical protein
MRISKTKFKGERHETSFTHQSIVVLKIICHGIDWFLDFYQYPH